MLHSLAQIGAAVLLVCLAAALAGCGAVPESTRAAAAPASVPTASPTTSVESLFPQPTAMPSTASSNAPVSATDKLRQLLNMADAEMQAARTSATLPEARRHAEAVVNVLVGRWGRWYGDADNDGTLNDSSDGSGVLPPYQIQTSADIDGARWQTGQGIAAFDSGDEPTRQAIQTVIMGNINTWKTSARSRYDMIARAVAATDNSHNAIEKLDGQAAQTVSWARMILAKAQSLDEAQRYAAHGAVSSAAALAALPHAP